MTHAGYYGTSALETNDISVFWNTGLLLVIYIKTSVYGTLTSVVLRSMLGLCIEKHMTMTNYDNGYYYRNEDGNEYINDDNNSASVSGSGGLIFDTIIISLSCGGRSGNDGEVIATMDDYISTLLKMCHKLLYAGFGVLDWCLCCIKIPKSRIVVYPFTICCFRDCYYLVIFPTHISLVYFFSFYSLLIHCWFLSR